MLDDFIYFITDLIAKNVYAYVFILMTLESFNVPIPSEVIMPFAGFLVSKGEANFWLVSFFGALGNLVGSLLSYFLADLFLRLREKSKLLERILKKKHLEQAAIIFKKYGVFSVFWSRVVPVIRTFISFPAGIGKMSLVLFIPFTFLGSLLWSIFLAYLGFVLGENWITLRSYFEKIDYLVVVFLLVLLLFFLKKKKIAFLKD